MKASARVIRAKISSIPTQSLKKTHNPSLNNATRYTSQKNCTENILMEEINSLISEQYDIMGKVHKSYRYHELYSKVQTIKTSISAMLDKIG